MTTEMLPCRPEMAQRYEETHAEILAEGTQTLHDTYAEWVRTDSIPPQSDKLLGLSSRIHVWEAGHAGELAVRVPNGLTALDAKDTEAFRQMEVQMEARIPAMVRSIGIDGLEQPVAIGGGRLWSRAIKGSMAGSMMASVVRRLGPGHFRGILDTFVAMETPGLGVDIFGANIVVGPDMIGVVDATINRDQPREEKVGALISVLGDCTAFGQTKKMRDELPLWLSEAYRDDKAPIPIIADEFGGRIESLHILKAVLEKRARAEPGDLWLPSLELTHKAIGILMLKSELPVLAAA